MNKKQIVLFGVIFVIILVVFLFLVNRSSGPSKETVIEEEAEADSISENEVTEVDVGDIYTEDFELSESEIIDQTAEADSISAEETETGIDIGELYD
jgi:uncharacterized membrane protein